MDRFKQKFIEEAKDLIDDLEKSLLALEDEESPDMIKEVFRVMHTLKGNSSMFGFDLISAVTHDLETLYDKIRHNQKKLTAEIITISFHALDHIKELLHTNELAGDLRIRHIKLLEALSIHSSGREAEDSSYEKEIHPEVTVSFYIRFKPYASLYKRGINPHYLIEDVAELGTVKVYIRNAIDPQNLQSNQDLYWEIILVSKASVSEIRDVFIFVDGDGELVIEPLAFQNILESESIARYLKESEALPIDYAVLRELSSALSVRPEKSSVPEEISYMSRRSSQRENGSSIKVSSEKLDHLMNLVSELVTTQARLSLFAELSEHQELVSIAENVEKLSRQLRDTTFGICLIPIDTLISRFNRLVRDLSKQLGKEVEFVSEGAETELDKSVVEVLADPLMHILRNSLDHGIESPEERKRKGKRAKGKLLFKAFYSGTNVVLQISDDGAGIDPEKIRQKAIEKDLISPGQEMSKEEILELIFLPGFSTAALVTDVSGRGVGMDVVKKHINDIRGEVSIDSQLGEGTCITIRLPLTLSIIDGLLVRIDHTSYVVPLTSVDKCYEVSKTLLTDKFDDLLVLDGQQVPFINLREYFHSATSGPDIQQIVVIRNEDRRVGFTIDEVVGEYQAVLKPLGNLCRSIEIVSGATILGDGTIALVLDSNKLIKDFMNIKKHKLVV